MSQACACTSTGPRRRTRPPNNYGRVVGHGALFSKHKGRRYDTGCNNAQRAVNTWTVIKECKKGGGESWCRRQHSTAQLWRSTHGSVSYLSCLVNRVIRISASSFALAAAAWPPPCAEPGDDILKVSLCDLPSDVWVGACQVVVPA